MTEAVRTGDVMTAFTRRGDGPPLLLLHGAEASREMFTDLIAALEARFTVIAYDQRDCGATEGTAEPATLDELAIDAHALLQALGYSDVYVFGTSFGGRLAQVLALEHPACVRRLALASTWALSSSYAQVNPHAADIRTLRAGLPQTAVELARWFFPAEALESQPSLANVFSRSNPTTERSRRRTKTVAAPATGDLSRITVPTLVLAGEADRVVPPDATRAMARLLPQARFELLPGVGHVAALQSPGLLGSRLAHFFLT